MLFPGKGIVRIAGLKCDLRRKSDVRLCKEIGGEHRWVPAAALVVEL
jgi:hypothetical protein